MWYDAGMALRVYRRSAKRRLLIASIPILLLGAGGIGWMLTATPTAEAALEECSRTPSVFASGRTLTAAFAPPYDPVTRSRLFRAYCDTAQGSVRFVVGDRERTYAYTSLYTWLNGQWQRIDGPEGGGRWKQGSVEVSVSKDAVGSWAIAYTCLWDREAQRWRCGCKDRACTSSGWHLIRINPPWESSLPFVPPTCGNECPVPKGAPYIGIIGVPDSTFQKLMGYPKTVRHLFLTGAKQWSGILVGSRAFRELASWQQEGEALGVDRLVVISVDIFPWEVIPPNLRRRYEGTMDALRRCAAGEFDSKFREFARKVYDAGLRRNVVIRLGPEWNLKHMPYGMKFKHKDGTDVSFQEKQVLARAFGRCFARSVRAMRSVVAGAEWYFDWNSGTIQGFREEGYPGDEVVDVVSVDQYDVSSARCTQYRKYSEEWQECRWKKIARDTQPWIDFARARGKLFAIPEWGLWARDPEYAHLKTWNGDPNRPYGGGDNPVFIKRMCELAKNPSNKVLYALYFKWPKSYPGLSLQSYPNGLRAFQQYCRR